MNVYAEPSGLAKPYLGEDGAVLVGAALEVADVVGTSVLSLAEVLSAVARAHRTGTINAEQVASVREAFLGDWPHYFRIAVQDDTVQLAGELVARHPLRGFDAVHLASAMLWQQITGQGVVFLCFDKQLRRAADAEGLWLLPDDDQLD